MSNLVEDDFQDVIGTLLVNHTPLTDTFGAGWVNANANILDIIDDPDLGGSETVAQIRASALDGGGIIRTGLDADFEVTGTVQFWAYSTSGNGYVGCRATENGASVDSYGVFFYPDGNTIDLLRVVNGVSTVLAAVSNSSGFWGYNDMEVSANGTTIAGAVTNLGITLGPVTDSSIALGQNAFISGHDRDAGGNRWRSMSAHSTITSVTVTDSANGSDVNVPLELMVPIADASLETDFIIIGTIDIPVSDTGNAIDSTTLNIDQTSIFDSGSGVESFGISNVFPAIGDAANSSDASPANANIGVSDVYNSLDSTSSAIAFALVSDNSMGDDVFDVVVIDTITINDLINAAESIGENIAMPLITDSLAGSDSLVALPSVFVADIVAGSEAESTAHDTFPVVDPVSGTDSIDNNIDLSVTDQSIALFDVVADAVVLSPVEDVGVGSESNSILLDVIFTIDLGAGNEEPELIAGFIPLSDSANGMDVVFPPFVGHFSTDAGFGNDAPAIQGYLNSQDISNGIVELPNISTLVAVTDSGIGVVVAATIESFGLAIFDTGGVDDDIANVFTSQSIPVSDQGNASESIGNGSSLVSVEDSGLVRDPLFVYKNDQKIVNIIFKLTRPRILFTLNTDEEHNP